MCKSLLCGTCVCSVSTAGWRGHWREAEAWQGERQREVISEGAASVTVETQMSKVSWRILGLRLSVLVM